MVPGPVSGSVLISVVPKAAMIEIDLPFNFECVPSGSLNILPKGPTAELFGAWRLETPARLWLVVRMQTFALSFPSIRLWFGFACQDSREKDLRVGVRGITVTAETCPRLSIRSPLFVLFLAVSGLNQTP